MAHFEEQTGQPYDWNEGGVYVIEREDPVDGGLNGVSNRQGRELTRRTRNLHGRLATSEGEIDTLQEALPIAAEAAKRAAIEHTDGQVAAVRNELALGDQAALRSAKDYADMIVAALVDGSPELLNTLEELATALGNDPNFATTVMTEIGKRATKTEVTTALSEKIDQTNANVIVQLSLFDSDRKVNGVLRAERRTENTCALVFSALYGYGNQIDVFELYNGRLRMYETPTVDAHEVFHGGNLKLATPTTDGLMAAVDKKALEDKMDAENAVAKEMIKVGDGGTRYGYLRCEYPSANTSKLFFGSTFGHDVANDAGFIYAGAVSFNKTPYVGDDQMYHSGNLKIIRGSVNANGYNGGGSGFSAHPEGNSARISHDLGAPSSYCFTGNLYRSGENGLTLEILDKGTNYIVVGARGLSGDYYRVAFDFELTSY